MPGKPGLARQALVRGYLRLHPDEAAQLLEQLPVREIIRLLETEPPPQIASLIERLTADTAAQVLTHLPDELAGRVLAQIDPSRAALLLMQLPPADQTAQLVRLDRSTANLLRSMMHYPPDSAGGLMDPRTLVFREVSTAREVFQRLRRLGQKHTNMIHVVDGDGRLVGSVPLQDVALAAPADTLSTMIQTRPVSVHAMATKEDVVELLGQFKLPSVPVVDLEQRLLGVIRHDTLVTATQEELSADMQTMVGASKDERALSPVVFAVRKRLPWLQINLATAFLASAVVGLFEQTIAQFTALAVLLPVVAGQSGNTGAQALAVTMRGLTLREIRAAQWLRVAAKELRVGAINGLAVALTTAVCVYLWSQSSGLTLVIGSAMVASMIIASVSGVAVPVVLTAAGLDPAQSSSIILTTVTDVMGFFSFLGIATLLASLL